MRAEFRVHMLNDLGKSRARECAEEFSLLLGRLENLGVSGRELAIVKTKLEEACFFAKRSIASHSDHGQPEES